MVENSEIERVLRANSEVQEAHVAGDGYHYEITIIASCFEGKRSVARQQWVYALIQDWISSGDLHAVSLKTYSPVEWEARNG